MTHAEAVAGTFWGHALPGSLLVAWALFWVAQAMVRGSVLHRSRTLESGAGFSVLKIALAVVGVWIEIPGQGWYPQDVMMNWQHVTMYSVFGLSGVVDLLARRGLLSGGATYVAYAAAMGNAGFLFWGHSAHGGVEGIVHKVLALSFFATTALALIAVVRPEPSRGLTWGRVGTQLVLGGWFIVGGWIIYRSGWDLSDTVREGWTYMAFSWTATAASLVAVGALLAVRARAGALARKRGFPGGEIAL